MELATQMGLLQVPELHGHELQLQLLLLLHLHEKKCMILGRAELLQSTHCHHG